MSNPPEHFEKFRNFLLHEEESRFVLFFFWIYRVISASNEYVQEEKD